MDITAVTKTALAVASVVAPAITKAADNALDSYNLESQDAESIEARLKDMRLRKMTRKSLGSEEEREFAPELSTVPEFTRALSYRRPDIGVTIKVIDVSGSQPVIKGGVTLCSRFGNAHIDQSLRGFLSKVKPMLERSRKRFTIDIITASRDEDLDAEQVLADTLYNIFNDECPSKAGEWPFKRSSKSREEISAEDADLVIARTMPHFSSIRTESQGFQFHSVVVTGGTGAGKSVVCCIVGGKEAQNSKNFRPARAGTGTTQVRAKRVKIGSSEVVLVDTPGFGDRHGGDALRTMSMSQQLVGEGKIVAHVHVVKHDEDRPGFVNGNLLDKYSDVLGKSLISRLVLIVTHKGSENVNETIESWREQKIASSTGEYGSALVVVGLDLKRMNWESLTHPCERELVEAIAKPLAMEPVPNQMVGDMERWLAKIQQGANQTEVERARRDYKTRYNAIFAQKMHSLWASGNVSVWRSGAACLIRSGRGVRIVGKRIVTTIVIIYEDPLDAEEGKRWLSGKSSLEAIEHMTKDKVAVGYDRVLTEAGVRFEAETNYFQLVQEENLMEVVVRESAETLRADGRILQGLFDIAMAIELPTTDTADKDLTGT